MKRSLKLKIVGPILAGFLVLIIGLMFWAISVSGRAIGAMDRNKGLTLAKVSAEGMWNSLLFQDIEVLNSSLKNLLKDPAMTAAAVFDKADKRLAGVGRFEELKPFSSDRVYGDVLVRSDRLAGTDCSLFSTDVVNPENREVLGRLVMAVSEEATRQATASIRRAMLIGGLIVLLLIGTWSFLFIGRQLRPLHSANRLMSELSQGQGDLRVRLDVKTRDEVGELSDNFNRFMVALVEIITQVKTASHQLNQATEEISNGSSDLAMRTNEQAASITQTNTTLEGFTAIVARNHENSEAIGGRLEEFRSKVEANRELMDNVTGTMSVISDSSRQIDKIVNVINDISFQTNLLALNAAVEAARAGDAGRGFAVVAAEVRNLAQKTAESSKSIQTIVSANVKSTQKGLELVQETSRFFGEIVDMLRQLVTMIGEITHGSREQSTGIEQINSAVGQLENVIGQNSYLVEQLTATSRTMKGNAGQLEDLVNRFVI